MLHAKIIDIKENKIKISNAEKFIASSKCGASIYFVGTVRDLNNEKKVTAFSQERMEEWYREAGAIEIVSTGLGNAMGASTHAYGGTRMGNNSETNVVDRWGFAHEAPNLGVLGASVMGTSGSRNPTLTVQALSWRTAEYLVNNWRSIVG